MSVFAPQEYTQRVAAARSRMRERDLSALLVFAQESHYVFFPHVMLGDRDTGLAMGLGNTVLITDNGAESLTRLPLDLMTKH